MCKLGRGMIRPVPMSRNESKTGSGAERTENKTSCGRGRSVGRWPTTEAGVLALFLAILYSAPARYAARALAATQSSAESAQNAQVPLPSFEVASIKPHSATSGHMMDSEMSIGSLPGDLSRWAARNVDAKRLIGVAYDIKDFQIAGGPNWIGSNTFDIDAKVLDSTVSQLKKLTQRQQQEQMALMLRSLLIDRFKLRVARGTKEGDVLALVIAKGGPKLMEVPPPDPHASPVAPPTTTRSSSTPSAPPGATIMSLNSSGLSILSANAVPISDLVALLSGQLHQQVVDQTGLKGTYEYKLQFASQGGLGGMPALPPGAEASAEDSGVPYISTALQEQLGLRLESTKGSIDVYTIEHIEQPSAN